MKEKIEKISNKRLIELRGWSGFGKSPNRRGLIVTKDKKLFDYYIPLRNTNDNTFKEYLIEKNLSDEQYFQIIKFIEGNIENKHYKNIFVRDAYSNILCNHKKSISILNNLDLYMKTKNFIEEIREDDLNEKQK